MKKQKRKELGLTPLMLLGAVFAVAVDCAVLGCEMRGGVSRGMVTSIVVVDLGSDAVAVVDVVYRSDVGSAPLRAVTICRVRCKVLIAYVVASVLFDDCRLVATRVPTCGVQRPLARVIVDGCRGRIVVYKVALAGRE